jgi:hypothetical protein
MMQMADEGTVRSEVGGQRLCVAGFDRQLGGLPVVFTADTNVVGGSSADVQNYVSYGTR